MMFTWCKSLRTPLQVVRCNKRSNTSERIIGPLTLFSGLCCGGNPFCLTRAIPLNVLAKPRGRLGVCIAFASCQLFATFQALFFRMLYSDAAAKTKLGGLRRIEPTLDSCHSVFSVTWRYYLHLTWRYHVQTRGLAESSRCEALACHLKIQKSTFPGLTFTSFSDVYVQEAQQNRTEMVTVCLFMFAWVWHCPI